ncbi:hypothetical protein DDZ13_02750 [Coraliomargarita sinensis]|uniref:Uncharacterized protein n=1 Tax=Coraliomargarita sinensis TaxID=2174842 RepID=A0A317ZHG3_9BACT|nr:hypothetical protein [Coraliomargarita sinensis]PXA04900.1 hypothetical protein DDZ13_02750 [Coraliomargarita sinensis]
MSDETMPTAKPPAGEYRFSLREMLHEVKVERRDSQFGRQLVDATEIDKMFSKSKRKKKKAR